MAFRVRWRKKINIKRVVAKIAIAVVGLYVGGTLLNEIGSVMNCTGSPFYKGLTLIGWTITDNVNTTTCSSLSPSPQNNVITSTEGSGVLAVVGIVAIASIVLEFVSFKF